MNQSVLQAYHVTDAELSLVVQRERNELARREQAYRNNQPIPSLQNKPILLIYDGSATSATMRVAAQALRQLKPVQFVIAVPVTPASVCNGLRDDGTSVVCLLTPKPLYNVGQCYDNFSQTTDVPVRELPQKASLWGSASR